MKDTPIKMPNLNLSIDGDLPSIKQTIGFLSLYDLTIPYRQFVSLTTTYRIHEIFLSGI